MIVKKLLDAWRDHDAGSTVVVAEDRHEELVQASLVEPTATVKRLIRDWEGPDGVTYPADTSVELDAATALELESIRAIRPTM